MFSWLWRSKLGPLYWLLRVFGIDMIPPKPEERVWRIAAVPKVGVDHKRLYKSGKEIFSEVADEEDLGEAIKAWAQMKNEGGSLGMFLEISGTFTVHVTLEQRDRILKLLKGKHKESWKLSFDEYAQFVAIEVEKERERLRRKAIEDLDPGYFEEDTMRSYSVNEDEDAA